MLGKRRSPEQQAHKAALKDEHRHVARAKRELLLGREVRAAKEAVKQLEKPVAELQAASQLVGTNRLFRDRLEVKGKTYPLSADVTAQLLVPDPRVQGPVSTESSSARASPSRKPSTTSSGSPATSSLGARAAKTRPTPSASRRRATNARTCADARSSHCSS
jgi:hypothetical protein